MPKSVRYKTNSIVYFKGDKNENVYILKSGRVCLRYNDIETGQEIQEYIKMGEFFGVKSALGKFPREETALVMSDAEMIVFSVAEFEALGSNNTRIIMKMLKVFSNQLRRIHKQVQSLLVTQGATTEKNDPEEGLFGIGEYFLNHQKYPQALYALRRYLTYYPSGRYATQATAMIGTAESAAQTAAPAPVAGVKSSQQEGRTLSDTAKEFYEAVSLFSQSKFREAFQIYSRIIREGKDPEFEAKAQFEVGRCLFAMEEYNKTVAHYTGMVQRYPKHPDLKEALFTIGQAYEKQEQMPKAISFYKKIITMAEPGENVHKKAERALEALGEA